MYIQIWRTPKHKLKSDDERLTFTLLQKYNGTCDAYMEAREESAARAAIQTKAGSHIHFDVGGKVR